MKTAEFLKLMHDLTGSPVKDLTDRELGFLAEALEENSQPVGVSQFNELLLLVNKDRVSVPFFGRFFCSGKHCRTGVVLPHAHECSLSEIGRGVTEFQKAAMLLFGNFIYAYRELSKCKTEQTLAGLLGPLYDDPRALVRRLRNRPKKNLRVSPIARENTYFTGYLSSRELAAERGRAEWIAASLSAGKKLKDLRKNVGAPDEIEREARLAVLNRIEKQAKVEKKPIPQVVSEAVGAMEERKTVLMQTLAIAERNTDVYLTWDYMDLYFATSMRRRWEYEDLHDFVELLAHDGQLKDLRPRYFDPTKSYDQNRVNKGLVESLMLKRAACTVYSVQDTDTLGKDSELAATLAQGKPVIAYAPLFDVSKRARVLLAGITDLPARLRFVENSDETVGRYKQREPYRTALHQFEKAFAEFAARSPWITLPNQNALKQLQGKTKNSAKIIAKLVAEAENRIYTTRANVLRNSHPLAIQVNLQTGVANGVLVTRTVSECAALIRDILTNQLRFVVEEDDKLNAWVLKEARTGCIYRVVTKNRKLTNCFWNFYRNT